MTHALDSVTSLRWRAVQPGDVPAVAELLTAIELHDDAAERHSLDELDVNMSSVERTAAGTAIGFEGGTAVAFGWNLLSEARDGIEQVFLSGGVHPSWRQLGIGRRLLAWQLEQARAHVQSRREAGAQCLVVAHCDEKSTGRRGLYRRVGLVPVRRHLDLYRPLSGDVPDVPLPAGVDLVPWSDELCEAVRLAHNDAFSDVWRAREVTQEEWAASHAREAARPQWSWVALDRASGEVVGYAINSASTEEWAAQGFSQGWTDRLGVRRPWRGRGVARALLVSSMRSFAAAGLQAAGLGVDTDRVSGPLQPYDELGYTVADSVLRHELVDDGR
ncbi:GNAT family N-acetyltransferase [Auraticoccus sp. F435]|uniref:GNAT family N-acetyltransferase n=1 Tax=Auraticoccus cholistanensis TaxID=2656650 RepID=A0A6A9V0U1_9ACTN|nr:GNAT family N-acetyltransferase [Auraticoccus cholistanensis]MVA75960.1 GNAT family N-acetyltransferase [Auraticoccus cholistanensis]